MRGGGRFMVLKDSEMRHAVYHAEYVAMSDVAKEILFLRQVWRFMLPSAGMPCIPLFEDNEGAIQIAKHPISNSNFLAPRRTAPFSEGVGRKEGDRDYPRSVAVTAC